MKTHKDTDLRQALQRKYADTPQLPADFMQRVQGAARHEERLHARRRWLYAISAVAASVLLLWVFGVGQKEVGEAPVVAHQTISPSTAPQPVFTEVAASVPAEVRPVRHATIASQPAPQPMRAKQPMVAVPNAVEPVVEMAEEETVCIDCELREMEEEMLAMMKEFENL